MKLFNYYSLLICLITLSPAFSRAAEVITTQDFSEMNTAGTLTFTGTTVGTTDFVTYTCSGSKAAWKVEGNGTKIYLGTA